MKLSIGFFSSLYISLLCASVSNSVLATQTEKPERWFEIEVILFKQLGDKKVLKEQFPDSVGPTNLPQYKKHFDLLSAFIQPRLTDIKQFMPLCNENNSQSALLTSLPRIKTPFPDAIKTIEQLDDFNMPEFLTKNKAIMQQRSLAFELYNALETPLFSTQNICIISRKDIEGLFTDEQLANFPLDVVDVDTLPTKVNALGVHISDSPYLIADKSLLLADIKQRLGLSKEFQPLLHFGWRQVGVTRNKAIPLKLFAGKNLAYQYQQALNSYQSALDEAKLAEQLTFQQSGQFQSGNVEQQEVDATAQREQNNNHYAEIKQLRLTQIFNEINTLDSADINDVNGELERQEFKALISTNEVGMNGTKQLNIKKPPIAPLQPWFLDGFLKVHLDHYLYITADFNVLSQSLDKRSNDTSEKTKVKLINFSQNKRVITGEIHYFDHPYIGMIVQIRRFDPSKPIEEAVTQVINQ